MTNDRSDVGANKGGKKKLCTATSKSSVTVGATDKAGIDLLETEPARSTVVAHYNEFIKTLVKGVLVSKARGLTQAKEFTQYVRERANAGDMAEDDEVAAAAAAEMLPTSWRSRPRKACLNSGRA